MLSSCVAWCGMKILNRSGPILYYMHMYMYTQHRTLSLTHRGTHGTGHTHTHTQHRLTQPQPTNPSPNTRHTKPPYYVKLPFPTVTHMPELAWLSE